MKMRLRALSACLAIGAAAIIMSGTAAAAATFSVSHPGAATRTADGTGGLAGGSDIPLAAGGGAVALMAGPLGLVAFRRWRQTRTRERANTRERPRNHSA